MASKNQNQTQLPAETVVPSRLVVSRECLEDVVQQIEAPGEATEAMKALFPERKLKALFPQRRPKLRRR